MSYDWLSALIPQRSVLSYRPRATRGNAFSSNPYSGLSARLAQREQAMRSAGLTSAIDPIRGGNAAGGFPNAPQLALGAGGPQGMPMPAAPPVTSFEPAATNVSMFQGVRPTSVAPFASPGQVPGAFGGPPPVSGAGASLAGAAEGAAGAGGAGAGSLGGLAGAEAGAAGAGLAGAAEAGAGLAARSFWRTPMSELTGAGGMFGRITPAAGLGLGLPIAGYLAGKGLEAWDPGGHGHALAGVASGAGTGAGIGSMFLPGWGTAAGAGIGGLLGLATSMGGDSEIDAKGGRDKISDLASTAGISAENRQTLLTDYNLYVAAGTSPQEALSQAITRLMSMRDADTADTSRRNNALAMQAATQAFMAPVLNNAQYLNSTPAGRAYGAALAGQSYALPLLSEIQGQQSRAASGAGTSSQLSTQDLLALSGQQR